MRSPFEREIADPYAADFVDLEPLNASASDAIRARIDEVRRRATEPDLRSASVTVLGPAGAGKTHLFARLRKSCGARASFVLLRPEVGVETSLTHVLAAAVDGLKRPPPGHEDSLLECIVGSFLASVRGAPASFPRAHLADLRARGEASIEEAVEEALELAERRFPEIDAEWLAELLRVPFRPAPARRAAMVWLSGREPNELDLKRLGRTERLAAAAVLPALRTLGVVAAVGAPLVLVFDQLENLASDDDALVHAHARVVADLVDGVRGLVVVQMALDAEWERRIRPLLTQAERARLEARVELMSLPSAEERDELLRLWLSVLPEDERPKPFPAPFSEARWGELRTRPGVTPRAILVAARRAMDGDDAPSTSEPSSDEARADRAEELSDRLEELWSRELERAREVHDALAAEGRGVDAERLVGALVAAASLASDVKVDVARGRQRHDARLVRGGGHVTLMLVQAVHPRSVASSLRHAAELAVDRDVRVVRQAALGVPPTWKKVRAQLVELRVMPRVEVLELTRDQVCELLAIHDFLAAARSQDLAGPDGLPIAEAEVRAWLAARDRSRSERLLSPMRLGADADEEPAPKGAASPREAPPPKEAPPEASRGGAGRAVLERLRLASVDRVVREAALEGASRPSVLEELRRDPRVRWFGRSIVWLSETGGGR
ncbi:MAG: hypothetical protein KF901_19575 [Myxococcales bacterium]|nr:hypothetical protein [Myxococcales bacterium]